MSRQFVCAVCSVLLGAALAGAAEVTPVVFVDFAGTLSGTSYELGPREIDTTGSFAAHNGTEVVSAGLGVLTNADGSNQESFEFDASAFNRNAAEFTGTAFVVEAVFTRTDAGGEMAPIMDLGGQCFIRFHDGLSAGCWNGSTEVVNNNIEPSPIVGETHHYAIVYDGAQTIDYYKDGALIFQSDNGSPKDITRWISWGNIRHSSVDGGRQLIGEYESVAFSTFTGTFDPEKDFILPEGPVSRALAYAPDPAEEATDVLRDTVLNWMPGEFAVAHDVYLGTNWDDVNDADRSDPRGVLVSQAQAGTTYDPAELLEFGQTYYWRIDEVNAAPDNTIFKGAVWSFTAEPFAYPIAGIVATSNGVSQAGSGPENTVDGSGLDDLDQHSTNSADMWQAGAPEGEALWIQYEFDRVYQLHELLVWNHNTQFEPLLGFGTKDVTVEYSLDGIDWTALGDVELARATGATTYTYNTTVDLGGVPARYARLVVSSAYGGTGQFGLSEIRFTFVPAHARQPEPADAAIDVDVDAALTWRAGRDAVSHNVYLGTDPASLTPAATVSQASFVPDLVFGNVYYWRVDEVNPDASPDTWEGDLWSFTTAEYATIDDIESYTDDIDAGQAVFQTWIDGWTNNTGSLIGYAQSPFAEKTVVHGGRQAMPLEYDNAEAPFYSEASRTWDAPQDWAGNDARTLRLYFYGAETNAADTLYVAVEDSTGAVAVVTHPNPEALTVAAWQAWTIPYSELAGVNMARVKTMYIGVGNRNAPTAGGSGLIFLDDIGFGTPLAYHVPADVTGLGDVVQGVPNDGDWPAAETPDLAIDDNVATKFLHFKGAGEPTGIRVAPAVGPTVVAGLTLTTANDTPGRDPITFELYGSNDGIDGPYTLIAAGEIADFAAEAEWPRFTANATPITFDNDVAYTSYQLLFPDIRGPIGGSVNSMQIAEIELIGVVAP